MPAPRSQVAYRIERVPYAREVHAGEGAQRVTAALTAALADDRMGLATQRKYGNAVNSLGMTGTLRGSMASDLLLAELRQAAAHGHTFDVKAARQVSTVLEPFSLFVLPLVAGGSVPSGCLVKQQPRRLAHTRTILLTSVGCRLFTLNS